MSGGMVLVDVSGKASTVMTTKGDIIDFDTERQRLAIGSANQILQVKSSLPSWETVPLADTVLTTAGDILYENATPELARLAAGSQYNTLQMGASLPTWSASSTSILTTTGDLLAASAANTLTRIGAGASGEVLTGNGAGVLPSFQAAGGSGGGNYELVGTTNTLDTSTYTYDSYHLTFSSIDMTNVTGLQVYASVPMDINSIGFRVNGLTADYLYNGNVVYNAGTNAYFGSNSADGFFLGHWRIGNYSEAFSLWIQCDESGESDMLEFSGMGTGVGSANDRTGCAWAGGRQNTDTTQAVTSVSCIEDGIDILAGGRLTVYKVTR